MMAEDTNAQATPVGLQALYKECRKIYPDQSNPLQVIAVKKYWLGGPDPLDYISMYSNPGNPDINVPSHWHYISFGLSDLHGDGRIHQASSASGMSGFGFELTFRLRKEANEDMPPTWPAALMQGLARYVFNTGKVLMVGDHIPWKCSLDNSVSRIQHMLLISDPELHSVTSSLGTVQFIQIVGITSEELEAIRHWNSSGVLRIMKKLEGLGGDWLITDMRREETIFELDSTVQEEVDCGIEKEGSDLTGVNAHLYWEEVNNLNMLNQSNEEEHGPRLTELQSQQIKMELQRGLMNTYDKMVGSSLRESSDSSSCSDNGFLEVTPSKKLEAVHLTLNHEAASLFPLIIRGRLRHGRHFTFISVLGTKFCTFVVPSVSGSFTDAERPIAAQGSWLQLLLDQNLMDAMLQDLDNLSQVTLPKTFTWPKYKIALTITQDE